MAALKSDGNCYICGKTLGKAAMKKHILSEHVSNGDEDCILLKIEGAYEKKYWLFVDIAANKPLSTLDSFLRIIWLECCGHTSMFKNSLDEISKMRKMNIFSEGDTFMHEYDEGLKTECLITVIGETRRPKQKNAVRLISRNIPPVFKCVSCGKPAEFICQECLYNSDDPYYCKDCVAGHEHGRFMPITNSPRSGICEYEADLDTFIFPL